jgi:multiple sugar transport system permease protein
MANSRTRMAYLFMLPALLIILAFSLYPLLYELGLSLTDWYLLKGPDPVFQGLKGFQRLFADTAFRQSLLNTAFWTIGTVIVEYVVALPLALLLNRRSRLNGLLTGMILLPWVTPSIVVAYTWGWLLDSQFGIIHYLLHSVGIAKETSLLVDPHSALWVVTLISGWKGVPFMAIALLASLKAISPELYEAAAVDGATLWQRFRHITLPLLRGVSTVMCLLLGILAFYSFDLVWITTKGGPSDSTMLVGVYLFRMFFERVELSYAATIGVAMLAILLVGAVIYLILLQRTEAQGG